MPNPAIRRPSLFAKLPKLSARDVRQKGKRRPRSVWKRQAQRPNWITGWRDDA